MIPRGPLQRQLMRNLKVYAGAKHPARGAAARAARRQALNSQEREGMTAMAETKTFEDLGASKGTAPSRPPRRPSTRRSSTSRAAPMPPASARTPSRASGSSRAPARSSSTARTSAQYFARPVLQMMLQAADAGGRPARASSTSSPPSPAAASPARPARCATASPRRSPTSSRSCAPVLKKGGFLTRDSRVVERKKYGKAEGPPQLPVLQALTPASCTAVSSRAICTGSSDRRAPRGRGVAQYPPQRPRHYPSRGQAPG